VVASYKHSSLFGHSISDEEKGFIKMTPGVSVIKLFVFVTDALDK
jgi:hypothetical protein